MLTVKMMKAGALASLLYYNLYIILVAFAMLCLWSGRGMAEAAVSVSQDEANAAGTVEQYILGRNAGDRRTIQVRTAGELVAAVAEAASHEDEACYYDIFLHEGRYELWEALDKAALTGRDDIYHRGLELPDRCNLYGIGSVVLSCAVPEEENTPAHLYTDLVSTINMHNTENVLKNLTIVGDNVRYCIHDDSGFAQSFKTLRISNCRFIHKGTVRDDYQAPYFRAICYGAGYTTGRRAVFENCVFQLENNADGAFYVHTHRVYNKSDCEACIDGCVFDTGDGIAVEIQNVDGAKYGGIYTVRNCVFPESGKIRLHGGNVPSTLFGGGNTRVEIQNDNNSRVYLVQ